MCTNENMFGMELAYMLCANFQSSLRARLYLARIRVRVNGVCVHGRTKKRAV